ncbi:hypothetical protein A2Z22_00620 [Candidatus Woesebacteria bacterium RBG_16_34_12]|uniref:FCP1 homology domain-containing protein n=1 Tax=Candidatus Woesebacteria bacterium RBG_16_34_12 TaxID=1802480 RepID=A0A1F7X905_9BACT|nr:MAG: hypothetical protein A2Z22_00620 [Candidatus Woesebacteria bacterium RBG_16_34_12]
MAAKGKIIKVGFDLDGVIIGKPPFVPNLVMEKLVRKNNHGLAYRFPESKIEKCIRWLSHYPLLRPPIKRNIQFIHELYNSQEYQLFVVSSRFSFLEERTKEWFKFYKLRKLFKEIYINLNNEQPHLYKEKMIKKLKLNVFIDDDLPLLEYLRKKLGDVELIFVEEKEKHLSNHKH